MTGREIENPLFPVSKISGRFSVKRIFSRMLIGILVVSCLLTTFLVISNNVQAGDYGVVVQFNSPSNGIGNVTPGVDFVFTVDVTNTGSSNSGEDINFTVELNAQSVAAGWTVTPSGTIIIPNLQMGPANKTTETVIVRAPNDAKFQDSAIINITVEVIGHKGEVGCQDTLQLRANVVQVYDVLMTTTQDTKTGDPGEEVSFRMKITNNGNGIDTFSFSAEGPELGEWSAADVTLSSDEFVYVYYNITIDPDHDTSDILITLNVSSIGDISGSTFDTLDITIHVNPRYEVQLGVIGPNIKEVAPEQSVTFNLTIQNKGTAIDTFDIEPVGPTALWITLSNLTVTLASEETTIVEIYVTPPEGSVIGVYNITINVTSQNDNIASDEYILYAEIPPIYEFSIWGPPPYLSAYPGDIVTFWVTIRNDGTVEDTYTIIISDLPPGWSHGPISPITIPPGNSGSVDIDIYIPVNAYTYAYIFNITVRSEGDPLKEITFQGIIEVNQVYSITLSAPITTKTGDIGDTLSYLVYVKNSGNGYDYIELTLSGEHADFAILYHNKTEEGQIIHLNAVAGGTYITYLNVTIPLDYWDIETEDQFSITINAESLYDPEIPPASDTLIVTTTVNPVYGVDILNGGYRSGHPGELETFLFEVENTGTHTDSYSIKVDGITTGTGGDTSLWPSEISFTPASISNLLSGQTTSVTMYVDIPFPLNLALIPPGFYNITVECTSSNDHDVTDTQIFIVNVEQLFWADIQDSVANKNVNVGESVDYVITIKNNGNGNDFLSVELEGDPMISGSENWGKLTHTGTGQIDQQALVDIELTAGESTNIILTITIPNRTDPEYPAIDPDDVTLNVIVKPSDEYGIDDNVFVTADINTIYEFNFYFLAPKLNAQPGEAVEFTLKIENKGTSSETFTCEIYQWEEDWSAYGYSFLPSPTTIPPDTIGEVTLSITTPSDLDIAISKDYNIKVRVHSSAGNDDVFKNCTIYIESVYDVELTTTGAISKAVNVGSSVSYQFSVRNKGNAPETFELEVTDLDKTTEGGGDQSNWAKLYLASDPSTPVTSLNLTNGETKSMILEITVPDQGDPNFAELTKPLQVKVETNSEEEPTVKDFFTTSTTINPIYSFELSTTTPANTKEGEPDDTVYFILQVRNTGTTTDTYGFRITSVDESIFTVPDPNSITNLNMDDYGTTAVYVTIINDNSMALVGTYPIEITANSKSDPDVTQSITLFVEITPKGDVELSPSTQSGIRKPKDTIDYKIKVTNKGNAEDTFELSLEGTTKEWGQILDSGGNPITQVTLSASGLPGSFTEVILRVTIPEPGDTKADETYSITLKATSTNTEDKYDTAQVSTKVEGYLSITLKYSGPGEPFKDYDPNRKSPKFSFRVTNNGNSDVGGMDIKVENIDPDWDYDPKGISKNVEPGGTTTFTFEFIIPSNEVEGKYDIQVYVKPSFDPSVESDHIFVTINITKPDLTVSDVKIGDNFDEDQLKGRVGTQVTITATVSNEGHSKAESIQVKYYEDNNIMGTETISSIDPGAESDVDFNWTVIAEDVELDVEITPIEEINEDNNKYTTIFFDLRPDLSFFEPKLNFSNLHPKPGQEITITTYVHNSGGNAEDVVLKFYEDINLIGTYTLDINYGNIGMATIEWKVPDKPGEILYIWAEIDHPGSIGYGDETSKSIKVSEEEIDTFTLEEGSPLVLLIWILLGIAICFMGFLIGYFITREGKRRPHEEEDYYGPEETDMDYELEWPQEEEKLEEAQILPPPPPPPPPPEMIETDEMTPIKGEGFNSEDEIK